MRNKRTIFAFLFAIIILMTWGALKEKPITLIFRSTFVDTRCRIVLNQSTVLDTILNSEPSIGLSMSTVVNASVTDKVLLILDSSSFKLQPSILSSKYAITKTDETVNIRKLKRGERLILE
jgi:hypothetical protein